MVHLNNEDLVSVRVHANIHVTSTEVVRVRHAVRLDPADRAWITN